MIPLVRFDRATLGYGRRVVLSDLTFDIPVGDFLGIVGPNGAGKTTVLRAILGSLEPISGTVTVKPGLACASATCPSATRSTTDSP
jgi:ABC-type cobalamin/Fe3+-siderophores transport system ATPase subunit